MQVKTSTLLVVGLPLLALVLVIAAVAWPRDAADAGADRVAEQTSTIADDGDLASARATTAVAGCPDTASGADRASGPLAGLTVECLATGEPVDAGAALAGKPALLNLWAYWCAPCARELPVLQQYADRASGAVGVVTVHRDVRPAAALSRLADYDVRLTGFQDPDARIQAALGAPDVLPVSVLLRADGTVARIHVGVFSSADEVAAMVEADLGVST